MDNESLINDLSEFRIEPRFRPVHIVTAARVTLAGIDRRSCCALPKGSDDGSRKKIGGLERIDILVNAAGFNIHEPLDDVTEAHFDKVMTVNVKGTFMVSQAAVRRMRAGGRGGAIINISSQMGHVGAPNRTVYCASKHAVEGMTKAMAVELAPEKIPVNSIGPTFILTPLTEPFFEDKAFREDTLRRIPRGEVGQPTDVMGAVVFLASPAAALITGAALVIDGGWTAW